MILINFLLIGATILMVEPVVAMDGAPLGTNSRWIVNQNGQRVKLACVNWVSHLDAVVAEGLSKKPVNEISKEIKSMGFNCVRLTWPTLLTTDDNISNLKVRQSLENHGLIDFIDGFQFNNPTILDLSLIQAFQVLLIQFLIVSWLLHLLNYSFTHMIRILNYFF